MDKAKAGARLKEFMQTHGKVPTEKEMSEIIKRAERQAHEDDERREGQS